MKRLVGDKALETSFIRLMVILVKRLVSILWVFYVRIILWCFWITQPVHYIHRRRIYTQYTFLSKGGSQTHIFLLSRAQKQNMQTHTELILWKHMPLASRNPVSVPMFRGEYAAGPLLCFSPKSLSYLEVHCCHKAESREKHCRAWWSSITSAQAQHCNLH